MGAKSDVRTALAHSRLTDPTPYQPVVDAAAEPSVRRRSRVVVFGTHPQDNEFAVRHCCVLYVLRCRSGWCRCPQCLPLRHWQTAPRQLSEHTQRRSSTYVLEIGEDFDKVIWLGARSCGRSPWAENFATCQYRQQGRRLSYHAPTVPSGVLSESLLSEVMPDISSADFTMYGPHQRKQLPHAERTTAITDGNNTNTDGRVGFHNTLRMGIEHTNNFGMDTTSACPNQAQEETLTATACVQYSFTRYY